MATLDATPGAPTANAYCTVDYASTVLTMRLDTDAWDEAPPEDQATALQWATRLIDEQVGWYGVPTYPDQALALPQVGLVDQWGRAVASDVIPGPVQQATALYALGLLEATAGNGAAAAVSGDLVIKSKKIGDTTITYQDISSSASTRAPVSPYAIPSEVKALLRPYGLVPGMGVVRLVRPKGAGMASAHPRREAVKQRLWQAVLTHLHAWVHRRLGLPPHPPSVPQGGA